MEWPHQVCKCSGVPGGHVEWGSDEMMGKPVPQSSKGFLTEYRVPIEVRFKTSIAHAPRSGLAPLITDTLQHSCKAVKPPL